MKFWAVGCRNSPSTFIVGPPGSGKTTLAHQMMFALATKERPAVFFTVLGEPPLKMLRYQQQFAFFDFGRIDDSIRFINLSDDVASGKLDRVLARITQEVESCAAGLVFVDSFRSIMVEARRYPRGALGLQQLIQQLGIHLSSWQATTFLVGEYPADTDPHPIFTLADGLLSLEQSVLPQFDGAPAAGFEDAGLIEPTREAHIPHLGGRHRGISASPDSR